MSRRCAVPLSAALLIPRPLVTTACGVHTASAPNETSPAPVVESTGLGRLESATRLKSTPMVGMSNAVRAAGSPIPGVTPLCAGLHLDRRGIRRRRCIERHSAPYVRSAPSSSAVVDLLMATRVWRLRNRIADSGPPILIGYSEGATPRSPRTARCGFCRRR